MVSLGEGFGVGFRGVVGGGFPVENKGKGEWGGGWGGVGWGPAKEPASQCARVCQNYPLAIYPLVSPRIGKVIISNMTVEEGQKTTKKKGSRQVLQGENTKKGRKAKEGVLGGMQQKLSQKGCAMVASKRLYRSFGIRNN